MFAKIFRQAPEFKADELKGKIGFYLIKKNNQIVGFVLKSLVDDDKDEACKHFFCNLQKRLYCKNIKITVSPFLKNLVIYDPEFFGQSLIKFPINDPGKAGELKAAIEKPCKLFVYKKGNHKSFGCRMQVMA